MKRPFALALLLSLCACSGLLPQTPPDRTYVLSSALAEKKAALPRPTKLLVKLPSAAPGLDSERIALVKRENVFDTFAQARWADNTPKLVQGLLIDALQANGALAAVGAEQAGFHPDAMLSVRIDDFKAYYADETAPPQVQVHLTGQLMTIPRRTLLASFEVRQSAVAKENRMEAVVAAFNEAATKAQLEVVDKTLLALSAPLPEGETAR